MLKEAFPDWETTCTYSNDRFECSSNGFYAKASTYGSVFAHAEGYSWVCEVESGGALCY